MFGGIDEVDWASLGHAYGPADDVPELLRGLASADPAERERALDGMYGAVHHQGDVYDSTLACIPFLLELAANPAVQDRGGIVELLTSIGGIDLDGDDEEELDPEDEEFEYAANYAMAASAVTAGADVFLGLLDAEDRGVRLAAPLALATLHSDPVRVLALLRERLGAGRGARTGTEPRAGASSEPGARSGAEPGAGAGLRARDGIGEESDAKVRFACVEAAGRIALRHRSLAPEVVEWLSGLTRVSYGPGLRLAALAQLARCAPDALPADVVPGVTGLLRELRAEPVVSAPPAERPSTPTLAGQLRELHEADTVGRGAPWTADLLRTLHSGLGDRVDDRIAILADQLCSPDWGQRIDAVRMSSGLLRTWRGAYEELVSLIGEQLADPEPRLAEAAADTLEELFGLAAPAADALADRVAADPGAWVREWASGPPTLGAAVKALARAGDRRAVPVLARILERPDAPLDLGYALDHLRAFAAPLAPALRHRLGEAALDDQLYDRAGPLLYGLTALRAAEAVPEVLRVLRGAPEYRREWVTESVLRALAAFGPRAGARAGARAGEAIPDLRMLLRGFGDGSRARIPAALAAKAAGALWAIEGDADAVLPVLRTALAASDSAARRNAATAIGALGAAGAEAAPALRGLLRAAKPWTRVDAAIALWRVTGDPDSAWPVLRSAWEEMPYTRLPTAECLADLGSERAEQVLRGELTSVRRHNAIDGGYGGHDIFTDEKLLALCRQALTREGPTA